MREDWPGWTHVFRWIQDQAPGKDEDEEEGWRDEIQEEDIEQSWLYEFRLYCYIYFRYYYTMACVIYFSNLFKYINSDK